MAKVISSVFVLELDMQDLLHYLINDLEIDASYFHNKLENLYSIDIPPLDFDKTEVAFFNEKIHVSIRA